MTNRGQILVVFYPLPILMEGGKGKAGKIGG